MLQQTFDVLVARNGNISDLLAGLQKKANIAEETIRDVRVYEAHSGKIYKELSENFSIAGVNEFVTLYAEKAPEEEVNMQEGERTINAFNFDREPNKPHGVPFKFVVKPVSTLEKHAAFVFLQSIGRNFQRNQGAIIEADGNQG